MFKRLIYEDWTQIVPILAFSLTFGVFLFFTIRAIRLRKHQADYMAQLPLEQETHHHSKS